MPMRSTRRLFLAGLVMLFPLGVAAQGIQYDKIELIPEKIAPNLTMLAGNKDVDANHPDGAGGRIGVLYGPDGILMVDSQYGQISDKALAAVKRISNAPIRYLVNTHIHIDHTGGNAAFAKAGATIYAREELRQEMMTPARDPAGYPVVTYGMGEPIKVYLNGEVVEF